MLLNDVVLPRFDRERKQYRNSSGTWPALWKGKENAWYTSRRFPVGEPAAIWRDPSQVGISRSGSEYSQFENLYLDPTGAKFKHCKASKFPYGQEV